MKPIALRMVSELKRDAPDMEVSGIGGVVTVRARRDRAPGDGEVVGHAVDRGPDDDDAGAHDELSGVEKTLHTSADIHT